MSRISTRVFVGGPFSAALIPEESGFVFDPRLRTAFEQTHVAVLDAGATLLSSHVAERFGADIDEGIMVTRDNDWVRSCDVYIGLLPLDTSGSPYRTDGTHVEMGLAIGRGIRVLLVEQRPVAGERSYYVRHLSDEPVVSVVDWEEFFSKPQSHVEALVKTARRESREEVSNPDVALEKMRAIDGVDEVDVRGVSMQVLPGVFSPRYSFSAEYLVSQWSIPTGARVLDLGTGCGVFSLFALKEGAASVVALDINESAVRNASLNLARHGFGDRASARKSDICSALGEDEVFDVLVMSPPFWNRAKQDDLSRACFDGGYRFLQEAFSQTRVHAAPGARLFVVFSDQGDVALLLRLAGECGWTIRDFRLQPPRTPEGHTRLFFDFRLN